MKKYLPLIVISMLMLTFCTETEAQNVYVHSHITKSGTIVQQHYRTRPDHSRLNNWSTNGQANPYTGKRGRKNP